MAFLYVTEIAEMIERKGQGKSDSMMIQCICSSSINEVATNCLITGHHYYIFIKLK